MGVGSLTAGAGAAGAVVVAQSRGFAVYSIAGTTDFALIYNVSSGCTSGGCSLTVPCGDMVFHISSGRTARGLAGMPMATIIRYPLGIIVMRSPGENFCYGSFAIHAPVSARSFSKTGRVFAAVFSSIRFMVDREICSSTVRTIDYVLAAVSSSLLQSKVIMFAHRIRQRRRREPHDHNQSQQKRRQLFLPKSVHTQYLHARCFECSGCTILLFIPYRKPLPHS